METLSTYFPGLLRISGQAAILIMLVLAAQWLCGARLKPRWRYMLWMLVMLRLILPWTVPSPASPYNALKFNASVVQAPVQSAREELASAPILREFVSGKEAPDLEQPKSGGLLAVVRSHLLLMIWAMGALVLAGSAVISHYTFYRRVSREHPLINVRALILLEDSQRLMGVRGEVELIETAAVESPTLFGFMRPRLLLPAGLVSSFSRDELRHVFLHELAHIKRHDIFTGWVMLALQIMHWFNPFVWVAFYRMRSDRELACDALALGCGQGDENESYGLTIVKLLEGFGQSAWRPGLAGILENKQQMKERIRMIAKFRKTERGLTLAVILLAGLALVTFTKAQTGGNSAGGEAQDNWTLSPLQQKVDSAEAGNQWAVFQLWDAYYHGKHGIQPDPAEASKWLDKFVQNVWVVRFEPVGDFSPKSPGEFLNWLEKYEKDRSGPTNLGASGFFRTTKQGDKLVASFLSNYPEQLKADLSKVPGLKVTSVEAITPDEFIKYEESPQESLIDFSHLDASIGVWAVRFEPAGDFSPKTPEEFLARIKIYSGQDGQIGFFRTVRQDGKLIGSFLADDPDQLKAALDAISGIKVIAVEKLTQKTLTDYENLPQESLDPNADARHGKFLQRMALDQKKYSTDQLDEAEKLYQVANNHWGSPEAIQSLQAMVKKYPNIDRTGCAVLYLAEMSQGKDRTRYLEDCMKKYDDCFYGDGVQVGAYARYLMAEDYKDAGQKTKAKALFDEIKAKYADAVDHGGKLLTDSINEESL